MYSNPFGHAVTGVPEGEKNWGLLKKQVYTSSTWQIWVGICQPPGPPSSSTPELSIFGTIKSFFQIVSFLNLGLSRETSFLLKM